MGRFESIRSQDTGRQALERGGQTPSTHLGRCRTVSLRPREVEPADPRDRRCGRASSRKIKKPVEGRFSPLPRSELVEAILHGRQPLELTATRLTELDL